MKLHALIACHNRASLTAQSLIGAHRAASAAGVDITFTVFDDGSTDETGKIVSELQLNVNLIRGDGTAFWAKSMASAEKEALSYATFNESDYFLWLNDDVLLDDDALVRLTHWAVEQSDAVLVGSMRDPNTGAVSYSGLRRSGRHPLRFGRVDPVAVTQPVETFNGNLVLVPVQVSLRLGGIDGGFSHGLADIDYGLRCTRAGIPVLLAPGTYGSCARNLPPTPGTLFHDWTRFIGPKGGGNFSSLRRILRKDRRSSWLVYVSATYGLWWLREIKRRAVGQLP